MTSFFRALLERFKNLFVTHAALDLEAEMTALAAERKAALHRKADDYDQQGLSGIALFIRQQADGHGSERPLADALVTARHLASESAEATAGPQRRLTATAEAKPQESPRSPSRALRSKRRR